MTLRYGRGVRFFAPHLLYPQVLDDNDAADRRYALVMSKSILEKCDKLWVFDRTISAGMQEDINEAKRLYINVRYVSQQELAEGERPFAERHQLSIWCRQSKGNKKFVLEELSIIGMAGIVMILLSRLGAVPLSKMFVGYDAELFQLTVHGFKIYSMAFLFSGFSSFGSAFFTSLNDGLVSALISFLCTFIFETGCILLLPLILGVDGIWAAIVVAEFAALLVTVIFFVIKRKKYHYV